MTATPLLIIVLAAGKGTRMKSQLPKVLHRIAGRSMLGHVLSSACEAGAQNLAVVVAPDAHDIAAEVAATSPSAQTFVQQNQLGTGDAVRAASPAIEAHDGHVIVLFGDVPLLRPSTIAKVFDALEAGAQVAVLGFEAGDPTGYGRLLCNRAGALEAIREHKDASEAELAVTLCNSGVMGLRGASALPLLNALSNDNAQGEYYLTDVVGIARSRGLPMAAVSCLEEEVLGINDRAQLATAEAVYQRRARHAHMVNGVTMQDPQSVYLSFDTRIGRDSLIEPHVVFATGVHVGEGVHIRAFSHIEDATIESGAVIGPYARLRPGAQIRSGARIGNFVEIKKADIGAGAKVPHLSYVGDSLVGERANIGAGTITCNYDGFNKHVTEIGAGAFIGSNSSLVAPVSIGEGAYVGSGSVITKRIAADALGLTRAEQVSRPGWAAKFRSLMQRKKST